MPRSRCQLRVCDPQIFLLLPLLARPQRHAPILQTKPVDTSTLSVHESKLAPRAAKTIGSLACDVSRLPSSTRARNCHDPWTEETESSRCKDRGAPNFTSKASSSR